MSQASPPNPPPAPNPQPAHSPLGKLFLGVTAVALLGWFAWLGYTALTKAKAESIVSRAQASAAKVVVVAELKDAPDKLSHTVTVKKSLKNGPAEDSPLRVENLPKSTGYTSPGDYLLLLEELPQFSGPPRYFIVGQQRSPGADIESIGAPMIYKWNDAVQAQTNRLFPPTKD